MKRAAIVIAISAFMLSACGTPSVAELKNDPKLMKKVAQECSDMKRDEMAKDESCQHLKIAMQELFKEQMQEARKAVRSMLGH